MATILPLVMAVCALGLIVVIFSVLSRVDPTGGSSTPGITCPAAAMTNCPSSGRVAPAP